MFICSNCGYGSSSWLGRCPSCGLWNTLVERKDITGEKHEEEVKEIKINNLEKINFSQEKRLKTGIYEFDRVLGGGLVKGEVVLLTGEPGVGKSTLVLQVCQNLKTFYISGEESTSQVKKRAERLGINLNNFLITEDLQIEGIVKGIKNLKNKVDVILVDSIQTLYSKNIDSPAGSINQLKEAAFQLIQLAKRENITVILIGHITKEGIIAGPKTLEHMVDCVLTFEGEKISNFRLLRANKNRFGPTDEIGIFQMESKGLIEVNNPLVFIEQNEEKVVGKAVVGVIEGNRPLFFEVQSLIVPSQLAVPRRVVYGFDYNKVLLLLAVLRKNLNLPVEKNDVYVNVVGGVNIKSTAADLGLIASVISSFKNQPLPEKTIFIGEVSLLGEVRKVYGQEKIIKEAKRLGFKNIISALNFSSIKQLKDLF